MSADTDLQAGIDLAANSIANLQRALNDDSLNPLESYSLDGEAVSRNEWRSNLTQTIKELTETVTATQQALNYRRPYFVGTKQVLR